MQENKIQPNGRQGTGSAVKQRDEVLQLLHVHGNAAERLAVIAHDEVHREVLD